MLYQQGRLPQQILIAILSMSAVSTCNKPTAVAAALPRAQTWMHHIWAMYVILLQLNEYCSFKHFSQNSFFYTN